MSTCCESFVRRLMQLAAFAVVVASAGCASEAPVPDAEDDAGWVGDVTTEGTVTTVRNEAGSMWGGTARLVEEASIGVDAGDDPYMLGQINAIGASADTIFLADNQVPAIRAYDFDGTWLYDIGGPGQGPGEYERLSSLAVASDGRVFARDDGGRHISIFSASGEYIEQYPMPGGLNSGTPMLLTADDVPYTITFLELLPDDPNRLWQLGMQAFGPDGPTGDPIPAPIDEDFTPQNIGSEDGSMVRPVPFYPQETWALTPRLDVLFGVPTEYLFEIRRADGSTVVVHKYGDPVPVDPDEAAWHRARETAAMQRMIPEWMWNGPEVPTAKPPYEDFHPTHSGSIWVRREGPGVRLDGCDENAETIDDFSANPCWADTILVDIFDEEGMFLDTLEVPEGFRFYPAPYVNGSVVIARVEDELGINRVKRYRLER